MTLYSVAEFSGQAEVGVMSATNPECPVGARVLTDDIVLIELLPASRHVCSGSLLAVDSDLRRKSSTMPRGPIPCGGDVARD